MMATLFADCIHGSRVEYVELYPKEALGRSPGVVATPQWNDE